MNDKILIVEDDESMRGTLWVILRKDYQVILVEDGESALEVLEKEKAVIEGQKLDTIEISEGE